MNKPPTGGKWRPVKVRFLEGGCSQQTPASIFVQGKWQDVYMLEGALAGGLEAADPYERRFTVQTAGGKAYLLRAKQGGPWRAKDLDRPSDINGRSVKY